MSRDQVNSAEGMFKLSAEAKSFVPRHATPADESGVLPYYVTNCYPFVQTAEPSNNAQVLSRDAGVRAAWNSCFSPRESEVASLQGPPRNSRPKNSRGLLGVHPMSVHAAPYTSLPFPTPRGFSPGGGAIGGMYPRTPPRWNTDPPPPLGVAPPQRSIWWRGPRPAFASNGVNLKHHPANQPTARKRSKSKTIICMDAAFQTDFSEEIARYTLAERPNSLYCKSCHVSTDSEEVDSDSGYSSPLHRKNQISNGTDASPGSLLQSKQRALGAAVSGAPSVMSYSSVVSRAASAKPTQCQRSESGIKTDNSEAEGDPGSGRKKQRGKRKKKRRKSAGDEEVPPTEQKPPEQEEHAEEELPELNFQDEEEFPNLLSGGVPPPAAPLSYSEVLRHSYSASGQSQESSLSHSTTGGQRSADRSHASTPNSFDSKGGKESKSARKRRKRREQANTAADNELAEISLEQEVLRELSIVHNMDPKAAAIKQQEKSSSRLPPAPVAKQPPSTGKKSKQPIALNIADMIDALEKAQDVPAKKPQKSEKAAPGGAREGVRVANALDASAPVKRGKEREAPRNKKPSPLKKVILKEREEKKRLRLLEETGPISPSETSASASQIQSGLPLDSDLSQDGVSSKASSMDCGTTTPVTVDMSPISQTSPVSMSPLSGSPFASGINSPIACGLAGLGIVPKALDDIDASVLMKIHSRRYREYCKQVLNKDIDSCCTALLQDLIRFQDRLFHKDPIKARSKRRIVLGLREVTKHLKLKKLRCVIISPNLERIQSKGGLDEALNNILQICQEQTVPFVFALGRRALGRACAKLVPVSVVGIFNYEGSEGNFKKLMDLMGRAREAYDQMVSNIQKELQEHRSSTRTVASSVGTQLFPHMGHSRTPSACSAISFTSSILSEPISENYPRSEPETDSRGYEIVKKEEEEEEEEEEDEEVEEEDQSSVIDKIATLTEIDDGHEADTEEDHYKVKAADLPPIDSIHSATLDLSSEILSQHSSKTLELAKSESKSCKVAFAEDVTSLGGVSGKQAPTSSSVNKDRIELWVADTTKQIEHLGESKQ